MEELWILREGCKWGREGILIGTTYRGQWNKMNQGIQFAPPISAHLMPKVSPTDPFAIILPKPYQLCGD